MNALTEYIVSIFKGLGTLIQGMKVTGKYAFTPWNHKTREYPDVYPIISDRFRGEVTMPHNEFNEHKCTACGICEMNCPNGSIEVISKMMVTPEGKDKKVLDQYIYHLGMCSMCNLCVKSCPSGAIAMGQKFEHAVWDRSLLDKVLNQPGSKMAEVIKEKAVR